MSFKLAVNFENVPRDDASLCYYCSLIQTGWTSQISHHTYCWLCYYSILVNHTFLVPSSVHVYAVYDYVCAHMCICMCARECMQVCAYICVCTCICLYVPACLYVCVYLYVKFFCVCVCVCCVFYYWCSWKFAKIILLHSVIIMADLQEEIESFPEEKWGHKVLSNPFDLWITSFAAMSWLFNICFSLNSYYWVYMTFSASFFVRTLRSLWHIFMSW